MIRIADTVSPIGEGGGISTFRDWVALSYPGFNIAQKCLNNFLSYGYAIRCAKSKTSLSTCWELVGVLPAARKGSECIRVHRRKAEAEYQMEMYEVQPISHFYRGSMTCESLASRELD